MKIYYYYEIHFFLAFPAYAILSLILGFAMIAMAIFSVLGYRHYRLEAEISSMTWKIKYNDILHSVSLNQVINILSNDSLKILICIQII